MENAPRIACLADDSPKAQAAYDELAQHYEFLDIAGKRTKPDANLGPRDSGFMLQVLHKYMHRNIPVYGMNCGSVGFLLNTYHAENLHERIANARRAALPPPGVYA